MLIYIQWLPSKTLTPLEFSAIVEQPPWSIFLFGDCKTDIFVLTTTQLSATFSLAMNESSVSDFFSYLTETLECGVSSGKVKFPLTTGNELPVCVSV
jgi:hypothetical protein